MGRISREDKTERFDDDVISQAIKLDEDSLTAQYLNILKDAYSGKKVEISDPVLKYAFSLQEEKIKSYLENQRKTSEQNSENGKKGAMIRWSKQRQQEEDEISFAEEVSPYPFDDFWNAYNYIKNKKGTSEIWRMMPDEDRKAAIEAVPKYLKWYENEKKRNPKHTKLYPKTFLLDKRFLDDFTIEEVTQTNTNSYGSNNGKSYKEAEFERNARTIVENLQAADRGELAYLSPFNKPDGEHQPF